MKVEIDIPQKVKILGISGSHRRGWNTDFIVEKSLEAATMLGPWVETDMIRLVDCEIKPCTDDDRCYTEATDELMCPGCNDDMDKKGIYKKILAADGIIAGSAVYWGNMCGKMKDFIDRTLPFCHGSSTKFSGAMAGKVGGALAVGLDVHGGEEITIMALHAWMFTQDMIVVGTGYHHPHGGYVGGMAATILGAPGSGPDSAKFDTLGMRSVRGLGRRVAEVALYNKVARAALEKWGEQFIPKYSEGELQINWDRFYDQHLHLPREHVSVPGRIGASKNAFEKWIEVMSERHRDWVKEYRKGLLYGRGVADPELIRKYWIGDLRVVLLSDEQIYRYSPEFYGAYLK